MRTAVLTISFAAIMILATNGQPVSGMTEARDDRDVRKKQLEDFVVAMPYYQKDNKHFPQVAIFVWSVWGVGIFLSSLIGGCASKSRCGGAKPRDILLVKSP